MKSREECMYDVLGDGSCFCEYECERAVSGEVVVEPDDEVDG